MVAQGVALALSLPLPISSDYFHRHGHHPGGRCKPIQFLAFPSECLNARLSRQSLGHHPKRIGGLSAAASGSHRAALLGLLSLLSAVPAPADTGSTLQIASRQQCAAAAALHPDSHRHPRRNGRINHQCGAGLFLATPISEPCGGESAVQFPLFVQTQREGLFHLP